MESSLKRNYPERDLRTSRARSVVLLSVYNLPPISSVQSTTSWCHLVIPLKCRFVLRLRSIELFTSVRARLAISQFKEYKPSTSSTIPLSIIKTLLVIAFRARSKNYCSNTGNEMNWNAIGNDSENTQGERRNAINK